jgi:hypothetical protein
MTIYMVVLAVRCWFPYGAAGQSGGHAKRESVQCDLFPSQHQVVTMNHLGASLDTEDQ